MQACFSPSAGAAASFSAYFTDSPRYAQCIKASKRVRWDIDRDVIRGRSFNPHDKLLPDGLTFIPELDFLEPDEQRLLSQLQGRSYANMLGLFERFIGAKMLELSRDHWFGDQTALEALVRFTDEEMKHQELFRRIEHLAARRMPRGYHFDVVPNDVAAFVLGKSTWAVLALTCHIELFTQAHYRASMASDDSLSALYRDVFLYHWKEESQHAIIDEMEWMREDDKLAGGSARDAAVDDLIALLAAVDAIVQAQARADASYFLQLCHLAGEAARADAVHATLLKAYRWQYIVSGALEPRFQALLGSLVSEAQSQRIQNALAPLSYAAPAAAEVARGFLH